MTTLQPLKGVNATSLIQSNIPLQGKTWFKTGGAARFYAEPQTQAHFQHALTWAQEQKLDVFILGEGANLLIADTGFDGLVIHPHNKHITIQQLNGTKILVTAGASLSFSCLIDWCLKNNLIGLEEFSGIPGTVGCSVFINIHYFEFLLSQFLVSARVIEKETGNILNVDNKWFNFSYDYSTLHENKHYLLDATFKLTKANSLETAFAQGRSIEIIKHRNRRYPISNTCGSFFRNFFQNEVSLELNGKKAIWIAYYLDKIGVKGQLSFRGARVSHKHANMIVTNEKATSTDVINLAREMQRLVKDQFGIVPQPECQLIGFKDYPLLKI